jgi:hypothetical protein
MLKDNKGCAVCSHRLLFGCKAYDEIPYEIAEGIEAHDTIRPDQKGTFVFEEGEADE